MTPQEEFDSTYITSTEIQKELSVTRPALWSRRKKGKLPGEIVVNDGHLIMWKRAEIALHIAAWKTELQKRRGVQG